MEERKTIPWSRLKKDDQITLHRKLKDRATGTPLKTMGVNLGEP
jgi:hypothetical protein